MDPNVVYGLLRASWFRFRGAELRFTPDANAEKARVNDMLRAAEDMADALDALNTHIVKDGSTPDWFPFGRQVQNG